MQPFYIKKQSRQEQLFMELLDNSEKIEWWFKNGESEIKYFAVPYKDENGIERSFYVDFIVHFKDGGIGLFDTKSGLIAKEAGPKAEGLQKYIKIEKIKGKNILGGIVRFKNKSCWFNCNEVYQYSENNLSALGWKILNI